jgi:hypothetical protein
VRNAGRVWKTKQRNVGRPTDAWRGGRMTRSRETGEADIRPEHAVSENLDSNNKTS